MVSASSGTKHKSPDGSGADRGGFCGALQRCPPTMPAILTRRLSNKENIGFGRVKVMLRVSDNGEDNNSCLLIDKKKRQVTFTEPTQATQATSSVQDRAIMVSAPKMFAFDGLFTEEDNQNDICGTLLSEVIPAVLDGGSDGCLLAIGYPGAGQNRTMLGSVTVANNLGAIPCAISWLYKAINEKRQKSGARFSVRVSALSVNATKPGSNAKDLLAALATESDESPGMYLRDNFMGGPTELRAPTAERAALFLDAALAGRTSSVYEPALIFTLHVYQYSLAGKGGVAGGRSRLHLVDLGGCANRNGGLPLSGVGNVILSILSGQRYTPNKEHPLTPLLKDCLAPLTCHVVITAHVSHTQTHADTLTTIQLASRIHRLRRRRLKYPAPLEKSLGTANQAGSSEGPDPSSSDFSQDTVIYLGPCGDDATDNEHPPVFIPSISSGDNRCAMNKALRGSVVEKPQVTKPVVKKSTINSHKVVTQSPTYNRTDSLKHKPNVTKVQSMPTSASDHTLYTQLMNSPTNKAAVKNTIGINRGSNIPTPKGSPMRKPPSQTHNTPLNYETPPLRQLSEEKWIDGPRVSKYKVAEARHLLREVNHVKQCETWIDGPNMNPGTSNVLIGLPSQGQTPGYGYMDNHKRSMIRQWVENQSSQVYQASLNQLHLNSAPVQYRQYYLSQLTAKLNAQGEDKCIGEARTQESSEQTLETCDAGNDMQRKFVPEPCPPDTMSEKSASNISENPPVLSTHYENGDNEEEDQDSGPSEVPPALPLIEPLSSREISHESVHISCSNHVSRENLCLNEQNVAMMDCGLQVNEDDIARAMGCEHPLSALSHCDISVVSSFHVGDTFSECLQGDTARNHFDQLARLREIFTSQLAMAEVTPAFRPAGSVCSEPLYRFNGSVCSEPAYRPTDPKCNNCGQSISSTPSQTSLPSLTGIAAIAGMDLSLRHPDGASDPNIKKSLEINRSNEHIEIHLKENPLCETDLTKLSPMLTDKKLPILPLLPISSSEDYYDSGHDESTPRASKHSGTDISRRIESVSGYHSVVGTIRDSDESSLSSSVSRTNRKPPKTKSKRHDKSLCNWLKNPFTCTYPDTEGEISDF